MTTTPMTPANGGVGAQAGGGQKSEKMKHLQEQAHERIEQTRQSAHEAIEKAGRTLTKAQGALSEQMQERPMVAAAAAVGVGLVLGLLLAPRGRR
jgi:ElaB/YqjD/DUF883 family membrane-anchored ribosome-binding protein